MLTRQQLAAALTALGYSMSVPKLERLASPPTASDPTGPPYRMWGHKALYRWSDALAWAENQSVALPTATAHRFARQQPRASKGFPGGTGMTMTAIVERPAWNPPKSRAYFLVRQIKYTEGRLYERGGQIWASSLDLCADLQWTPQRFARRARNAVCWFGLRRHISSFQPAGDGSFHVHLVEVAAMKRVRDRKARGVLFEWEWAFHARIASLHGIERAQIRV